LRHIRRIEGPGKMAFITGAYASIEKAAEAMVKVERQIEPDPIAHAAYRPFYEADKRHYATLKAAREASVSYGNQRAAEYR
jgi:sugar (pentulose or hexulose) kinase